MAPWKIVESREHKEPQSHPRHAQQRWLFVTGLPVLAGTLCVMAMMFNICALSSAWQQPLNPNDRKISRPTWTVALQVVSLVIAVAAYIVFFLLMRIHDRPVTVFCVSAIGWLFAAALLFSVVGVSVHRHRSLTPHLRGEYTQAFYYGVFAAGLYALVALFLALYIVGLPRIQLSSDHRRRVQRTNILLRSLWLAIVLLVGAAIYRAVEGWPLLDALYFVDFTILTIGIGNLAPRTHLGRSLLFPYATVGIIALGLVVSAVLAFAHDMRTMKLRMQMAQVRGRWEKQAQSQGATRAASQVHEIHRVRAQFRRRRNRNELILFLLAWLVLWFISAAVFRASETQNPQGGSAWSYFVALYFTYTSLTTIGYGDYYPTSSLGKAFFVFWSLLALPVLTNLVTAMGELLHGALVFCSGVLWRRGVRAVHMLCGRCFAYRGEDERTGTGRPAISISNSALQHIQGESVQDDGASQSLLRLLIVDEMDYLISILRDGSEIDDLVAAHSRVLSLLQSGEQEGAPFTASSRPHHRREEIARVLGRHGVEDRNTEILGMLTLLARKLRVELGGDGL
ncbi:potassium channel family protein [Aspergillus lucknowensis]|uniref:Potassium channel domain-containing protein n=1 Tax=Aspergillus lucknowensis TaxID=176173 RepID=A0ABR4M2C4_9EURO